MTEQNDLSISELQQQANNGSMQAKKVIYSEMEKMRKSGQRLDIQALLQLIKQQACEFSKDEILEIIFSDRFGLGRGMGQSFTPNKVAELISVIGEINKPKSVIDICCGTGNVLSYFKNLQTVKGIDINSEIVELAQYINPDADIVAANTLIYDFGNTKYDLIVGNLPFGARTADKKQLDIELIHKGLELLNRDGVAIFMVSEGLLSGSSSTIHEFRQKLLSNFSLDMVVSLPVGILPYTSIKTSILVIRNGTENQEVFMPVFEDNPTQIAESFKQHQGDFYFSKQQIADNEYRLDRNRYESLEAIEEMVKGHKLIKLSDVAEIICGRALDTKAFTTNGRYLSFNRKDKEGKNFINELNDKRCLLNQDDIVVSLIGPNNKIYFHKDKDTDIVITNNYAIIRPTKDNKYVSTYLQTEIGQSFLKQQIKPLLKGAAMQRIAVSDLSNIAIPLLPLSELNELVSKTVTQRNKIQDALKGSYEYVKDKQYGLARTQIKQAFENADSEESQILEIFVDMVEDSEIKDKKLEEKEKDLEDMMSMFAHKFRSPLDAIIYNTSHDNNPKLYAEAAQTMRGLLDIFSIISTDDKILTEKIKADCQGNARLNTVLSKTLNMILLHLLSASGTEKIHQHYLAYAKAHGKIAASVTAKEWYDDHFELEQALQAEWEQDFAALLSQSAPLAERLVWLEQHFFKLELIGFDRDDIQFKEYAITESLLTILLNEILVNAFKYYSSETRQAVVLEWSERDGKQILSCRNPSIRRERTTIKGSGKGHTFLSALARKIGGQFTKPKPQDDFVLEFGIPDELLVFKS